MDFRIPLGQWVESLVDVFTGTLQPLFDVLRIVFLGLYDLLQSPPFWIILLAVAVAVLRFFAKGWKLAVGVIVGFGIEPGAGLPAAMENEIIPTYGLDGMEFPTSSTAAMLSELKSATDKGENIVVTLWEPLRAYAQFPIKNLEDTEGAFGDTESLYSYGSTEFTENSPKAAAWLEDFTMDSETLMSLVEAMFIDYEGDDYAPVVENWIEDNQDYVDGLTA